MIMNWMSERAKRVSASAIREILKVTEKPGIISLAGGLPSPLLFPVEPVKAALEGLMQTEPEACLQYGPTEGVYELREWVARAHSSEAGPLSAENVLITTGSQQALDLIGKAFIDAGDCVMMENPSYLGAIQAISLYQPKFEVLPTKGGMIDVEALAEQKKRAKLIYLIPNFQNPTGRLMDLQTRKGLANYSRKYGQVLIEDNPYGEIQFEADKLPSLRSLCPKQTVYLGSFSKILAPGLRVGYVIAEPAIVRTLTLLKQSADLHTASLNQRLVLSLLQSGVYEEQVKLVRRHYRAQCERMVAAIKAHFPREVRMSPPFGGMFAWCVLPNGVNATELLADALKEQVAFVPGEHFYFHRPETHTMRLSFVTTPAEKMDVAIRVLGKLIDKRMAEAGVCEV
jgi:2-aminoadipate transaminase